MGRKKVSDHRAHGSLSAAAGILPGDSMDTAAGGQHWDPYEVSFPLHHLGPARRPAGWHPGSGNAAPHQTCGVFEPEVWSAADVSPSSPRPHVLRRPPFAAPHAWRDGDGTAPRRRRFIASLPQLVPPSDSVNLLVAQPAPGGAAASNSMQAQGRSASDVGTSTALSPQQLVSTAGAARMSAVQSLVTSLPQKEVELDKLWAQLDAAGGSLGSAPNGREGATGPSWVSSSAECPARLHGNAGSSRSTCLRLSDSLDFKCVAFRGTNKRVPDGEGRCRCVSPPPPLQSGRAYPFKAPFKASPLLQAAASNSIAAGADAAGVCTEREVALAAALHPRGSPGQCGTQGIFALERFLDPGLALNRMVPRSVRKCLQ